VRVGRGHCHARTLRNFTHSERSTRNPIMNTHTTTLEAREEIAQGTMAFRFHKPTGFEFVPGQAIDLVLSGPTAAADDPNVRHAFSIVSAPFEEQLVIATRMRDSVFKRALQSLPLGSPVMIDGPFGSLGLHNDRARAAVLLAGGIGITPFVSMLRQATHDGLAQRLILLYSNRRPEDAAYLGDLQRLEEQNPHLRLVATMTDMHLSSRPWPNQTGLITAELVASVVGDLPQPIFYVVGPPGMVEALSQTLHQGGVDGDDIRSETFYGY
jgi:ferredoxin-NADP reductase